MKSLLPKLKGFAVFILIFALSALALEVSYRAYLRISGKKDVSLIKFSELLEEMWFQPHPHLVYIFRPNHTFAAGWAKKPNTIVTTNSFGFRSTLEYDISITKSPNTLRIATLGGSTTMGYNGDDEIWPYLIGKELSTRFPDKKIEVLNEGIMGYTTLDNLIDLSIRVIDFESDIYILYLGVNDHLTVAPLEVYRTDHSHFRRTLYQSASVSLVEITPGFLLKSKVIKRLLWLSGAADRQNLLENTVLAEHWKQIPTDEGKAPAWNKVKNASVRNVAGMVGVIKENNPDALIILSSIYHLTEPKRTKDLNSAFREYADRAGIFFVDAAKEIPHEQRMTYDNVHFTKEGDVCMAELLSEAIVQAIAP